MSYRIVLWTTGHVAKFAGRAILDHPEMDLVGAYAWSPDKVPWGVEGRRATRPGHAFRTR